MNRRGSPFAGFSNDSRRRAVMTFASGPRRHPLLPRPGDTIATHKRNAATARGSCPSGRQGFSGTHGHGIVLAKDGSNLEQARGP